MDKSDSKRPTGPGLSVLANATIERYEMVPAGAVVLVMVSGGADSSALLRVLASGAISDDVDLSVLHVNHLLRGEAADEDAAFVAGLAESLDVPCRVIRYDVDAYARENGLNLEDAGRRVRYRFAAEELDARCDMLGAPRSFGRIAVGHTLDDRVETFLMRVATGAGASGLTSLRPVRDRIVRPLLGSRRADVIAYLEAGGFSWREDATNADTSRLRSRVRHDLVPVFESINASFGSTLSRTIDLLADEDDLLADMARAFSGDFVECQDSEVRFERSMMMTLSRPMARRTVREALIGSFPEASRLESHHIEALVDGLAETSFARDLPEGLRAYSEYGRMVVSRTGDIPLLLASDLLNLAGTTPVGGGEILVGEADPADTSGNPDSVVIDADVVAGDLMVGSVREGDRMRPLGMDGSRKLSDMLIDAKVPRLQRGMVPVVRDGERIVWLAGVRMSDVYKVKPGTRRALRLTWTRDV